MKSRAYPYPAIDTPRIWIAPPIFQENDGTPSSIIFQKS